MDLENIKQKLTEFFESSENRQADMQENLTKIINKLEQKKSSLKEEMLVASEDDETSDAYIELEKEYKVVSKLLKKAKRNFQQDNEDDAL